ncbi:FtsX-like permease family protein [Halomonas pacifica]|uniref:ABC transporter permease n=1 Tax=Bisbaumannia pacifica TaxID=77098 RepID=UPI0023590E06|nr:FtsX-like permease family protein [Halomonas pacifica]MDC8802252.1 FtsX-like permease family protein [Halomonas pacifica]
MRALQRKLLRELWRLKGQGLAIAAVVASAVITLVVAVTTLDALQRAQADFYASHRFAELFVDLKRAPLSLVARLETLDGVNHLAPRIRVPVRLTLAGVEAPIRGQLLSLPDGRQPELNRLYLVAGRLPARDDQVVVSDAFAEAHGLAPGDGLGAIIEGRQTRLTLSGIARSPDVLYQVAPTDLMPDYERYAILWMNQRPLGRAAGLEGAFNQLGVTLQAGAIEGEVIAALDALLGRYGGTGTQTRHDQQSHRFLEEELAQQRAQAWLLPTLFLLVAAFLLHVVIGRVIETQRESLAVLKAFGYGNATLAWHFAQLAIAIVSLGWALGVGLGAWGAAALGGLYAEYFRFPALPFRVPLWVLGLSLGVVLLAALSGAAQAVWRAVRRPPAEAMRPPAPQRFRRTWPEALPLGLGQEGRMVLRHLGRHPAKASLSVLGIALSAGLLVMGAYQARAIDTMLDLQYRQVLRMDLELTFAEVSSPRALGELRQLPGVRAVEPFRRVPVTLQRAHRRYRTSLLGLEPEPALRRLIDARGRAQPLPEEGLLLTRFLADWLGVAPGEMLEVAIMEGRRARLELPLAGVVDEPIGVGAYLRRDALARALGEGPALSGAWLLIDSAAEAPLIDALNERPRIAAIGLLGEAESHIRDYIDETLGTFALIFVTLAASIAIGVIYNNARITFAERARELATLRVLGYGRLAVARLLLAEMALLTALALPLGWAIGAGFAWLLGQAFSNDLFRLPFRPSPGPFAFATLIVCLASLAVAALTLRRLARFDTLSVLKAPE